MIDFKKTGVEGSSDESVDCDRLDTSAAPYTVGINESGTVQLNVTADSGLSVTLSMDPLSTSRLIGVLAVLINRDYNVTIEKVQKDDINEC